MQTASPSRGRAARPLPVILFSALAQGIALYALHLSVQHKHWPASDPAWLLALYGCAIYLPLTLDLLAAQVLERSTWVLLALIAALFFFFGYFHGSAIVGEGAAAGDHYQSAWALAVQLLLLWLMMLPFVQNRLLAGRWQLQYAQLFALAWRNKLTLAEAAVFTALFWSLLFLWQALFHELKIEFFRELFQKPLFIYPVSSIAFGVALQLIGSLEHWTAVVLEQGLNVLKWLGIVAGLILTLFTVALLLKLPALLTAGQSTIDAAWLLWLVAVVVLLLNAAYRDGSVDRPYPPPVGLAVRLITPLLAIVALSALYSVALRTHAYGLTVQRFWALVAAGFAIIYALGYSWAALQRGPWMGRMGRINVAAAAALIAVIALALTPLLSPYRLAADSQYQQALRWNAKQDLHAEALRSPFHYLRFDAGTYGLRQLHRLASLPAASGSADVARLAGAALAQSNRYASSPDDSVTLEDRLARAPIYPAGRSLTPDLRRALLQDFQKPAGAVFRYGGPRDAWVGLYIDLDQSHEPQFVLFRGCAMARVYQHLGGGWRAVGTMLLAKSCGLPDMVAALQSGSLAAVPPAWNDLRIGDHVYRFEPIAP